MVMITLLFFLNDVCMCYSQESGTVFHVQILDYMM